MMELIGKGCEKKEFIFLTASSVSRRKRKALLGKTYAIFPLDGTVT